MNSNNEHKILVAIAGPTASGKTELSLKIAANLGADIISADSRQVYREMEIGTARPDPEELQRVAHHFIGNISVTQEYNVGLYEHEVMRFLNEYFNTKDIALICGGSGLYLEAVLNGIDDFPEIDRNIIDEIQDKFEKNGLTYLQNELKNTDPEYFDRVDIYNPHRLIRALSVIKQTGKPFSCFLEKTSTEREFSNIKLLIDLPRKILYERINKRVDNMMERGLEDEARKLYEHRKCKALQTVGYKELFSYFDGLVSIDEATELIKRNTRRYAKRQMTWFNNRGDWLKIDPDDIDSVYNILTDKIKQIEKRYS
ncbi:MAG: tRNA (adenosine(37)-N6)-dimethylallyltransferase MiaA [Saprospiraceae bacterium]|nr:tRNA (adenosine(37)-N6)-dimethylallyltransferase MiaA [Saprospiraceae bacterium]